MPAVHRPLQDESKLAPVAEPAADSGGYSYRWLTMSELPLLNDLYNACLRCDRPMEEAEWLYRNPCGAAMIMAAFDAGGELAGVRPAIPWKLSWQGEERTAYEFCDALVDPRHRNRGIFTRLVGLICEWAARNDFTLFTIPNSRSLSVYERTGLLQVIGNCETLVQPISWPCYARYIGHRLGLNSYEGPPLSDNPHEEPVADGDILLTPVSRFRSDFVRIHSELAKTVGAFTRRRAQFLQWRYFGSPVRHYHVALIKRRGRVRGYLAIRMVDGIAHVLDVFIKPDMELACGTFRALNAWVRQMNAIAIHFTASQDNFYHRAAQHAGFWLKKTSGSLLLDSRSARRFASQRNGGLEMRDFYFVMGDFDFI
ncbi:MAG: GNAT family N-acetyltransferase [Verrucomicrobiota bacterium]